MDWWLIALLAVGMVLFVLRLRLGPAEEGPRPARDIDAADPVMPDEPEPWEAEALARYGTETSVDQLIAEGRADELRRLGYEGELPEE